jgi:initiation factor 1A
MVKNKLGGNQGKKIARKNTFINKTTVVSKSDEEIYGIIVKVLGGSQFEVKCNDNINRLCLLRKKFTGKNKHNNFIKSGVWVLIGIRNWETKKPDKLEKCDLIECYSEQDKIYLQNYFNVDVLLKEEKNFEDEIIFEDDIIFEDEIDINDI